MIEMEVDTPCPEDVPTERLYAASVLMRQRGQHSHTVWPHWAVGWSEAKRYFQRRVQSAFPSEEGWWVDVFQEYVGIWRHKK